MRKVPVSDFFIGQGEPLTIISGPCVIESEESCLDAARKIREILSQYPVNFIFKSSYDKANRTSVNSYRGPGLKKGLQILAKLKKEVGVPILTDVHGPEEAAAAGEVCDVLQIPAFLCRQTDLIIAAGRTGRVVQIKKGQFLAPWDIEHAIDKVLSTGNHKILIVERGVSFGYNNLVSDMRSIPIMKEFGYPVCYDATHSVQLPGGLGAVSGGERKFVRTLACASIAAGADALYIETHPKPETALSDAATQLSFEELRGLLKTVVPIYEIMQKESS